MEKDSNEMKKVMYEYMWSSLITFITAFAVAVAPTIGSLPMDKAAIFALVSVGFRAGVRAVVNLVATKFQTPSSQ